MLFLLSTDSNKFGSWKMTSSGIYIWKENLKQNDQWDTNVNSDADAHYPVLMQGFDKQRHQWDKAMQCQDHHNLAITSRENDPIKICTMKF